MQQLKEFLQNRSLQGWCSKRTNKGTNKAIVDEAGAAGPLLLWEPLGEVTQNIGGPWLWEALGEALGEAIQHTLGPWPCNLDSGGF